MLDTFISNETCWPFEPVKLENLIKVKWTSTNFLATSPVGFLSHWGEALMSYEYIYVTSMVGSHWVSWPRRNGNASTKIWRCWITGFVDKMIWENQNDRATQKASYEDGYFLRLIFRIFFSKLKKLINANLLVKQKTQHMRTRILKSIYLL